MPDTPANDPLKEEALRRFADLVGSVGVKRFAQSLDLSTRQINRILAGAQPNPVERLLRSLQSADPEVGDGVLDFICQEMGGHFVRHEAFPEVGDGVLDFICQEMGGHFVRHEAFDEATVNAVRECAEAIAAISDGEVSELDVKEIREAISALSGLIMSFHTKDDDTEI
ncbi:MAG: hypothetical protein ACYTBR_10760 [Planctomycetota bacterium]|jgi:hypothetical protein